MAFQQPSNLPGTQMQKFSGGIQGNVLRVVLLDVQLQIEQVFVGFVLCLFLSERCCGQFSGMISFQQVRQVQQKQGTGSLQPQAVDGRVVDDGFRYIAVVTLV